MKTMNNRRSSGFILLPLNETYVNGKEEGSWKEYYPNKERNI